MYMQRASSLRVKTILILVQYISIRHAYLWFFLPLFFDIYISSDSNIYSHDFLKSYIYLLSDLCIRIVMDFTRGLNNDQRQTILSSNVQFSNVRLATLFKACSRKSGSSAGVQRRQVLLRMQFSSDNRGAIYRVNRFLDVYVVRTNYTMPSRAMLSAWFVG